MDLGNRARSSIILSNHPIFAYTELIQKYCKAPRIIVFLVIPTFKFQNFQVLSIKKFLCSHRSVITVEQETRDRSPAGILMGWQPHLRQTWDWLSKNRPNQMTSYGFLLFIAKEGTKKLRISKVGVQLRLGRIEKQWAPCLSRPQTGGSVHKSYSKILRMNSLEKAKCKGGYNAQGLIRLCTKPKFVNCNGE